MVNRGMQRRTRPCRHCGYAYKSRGIYADHGLAEYNLRRHVGVCLEQQARCVRKRERVRWRRVRAAARRGEPIPGQLGFPFDGIPTVVE